MKKKTVPEAKTKIFKALDKFNKARVALMELVNSQDAPADYTDVLWSLSDDSIGWTPVGDEFDSEHPYACDIWGSIRQIEGFTLAYLYHCTGDKELAIFDDDNKVVEGEIE